MRWQIAITISSNMLTQADKLIGKKTWCFFKSVHYLDSNPQGSELHYKNGATKNVTIRLK